MWVPGPWTSRLECPKGQEGVAVDVTSSLGFYYSLFEMGVHANPFRFENCERIDGDRVAET